MTIKVCEYELKCCPCCGSKKIRELDRRDINGNHQVICERCSIIFIIPCED